MHANGGATTTTTTTIKKKRLITVKGVAIIPAQIKNYSSMHNLCINGAQTIRTAVRYTLTMHAES